MPSSCGSCLDFFSSYRNPSELEILIKKVADFQNFKT